MHIRYLIRTVTGLTKRFSWQCKNVRRSAGKLRIIRTLPDKHENERFTDEALSVAAGIVSDPALSTEMRQLQEDFDAVDNTIERIEAEERASGVAPDEKWWH